MVEGINLCTGPLIQITCHHHVDVTFRHPNSGCLHPGMTGGDVRSKRTLSCVPTEQSQCRSHQNEQVVSSQSLCLLCPRTGREEEGREGAGWSRSCWTRHWLTAPGCWPWARAGAGTAVAEDPWARGSSASGQVRGDRRSSGAEWCWETAVEPLTPPSTLSHPVLSLT